MKRHVAPGFELVAAGEASVLAAATQISECASCSRSASQAFQSVLGRVLGDRGTTEYFVCRPLPCPRCGSPIFESTLVSTREDAEANDRLEVFEPPFTETTIMFIDPPTLLEAEGFIAGCEHCAGELAEITFDYVLDAVTGADPATTEYVVCQPAKCPCCNHDVVEKTLIVTPAQ